MNMKKEHKRLKIEDCRLKICGFALRRNFFNNNISVSSVFSVAKNSGSVLLIVVFAIALLTAFVAGMLQLNAEQIQLMRNEVYAAQAQTIAEAGMSYAFAQLRKDSAWTTKEYTEKFGDGSYTVSAIDCNVISTGTSAQGFTARVQADITIGGIASPYVVRVDKLRINE
jgi:Tfp pilus assembly protein PilX